MTTNYLAKNNLSGLLRLQLHEHFGKDENGPFPFNKISGFYDLFKFDRESSNEALKIERNNLFSLLNTTKDLMWSISCDLKLISSNAAFDNMIASITGKMPQKGCDIPLATFTEEKLATWRNYYGRAFFGESFTIIEHMEAPNEIWSEITFYPIMKNSKIIGTACYSKDISDMKRAEGEIRKLNAGLETRVTERTADLEQSNRLLEAEAVRVLNASKIIEQKNKDITDSLNYAKLIQNSIVHKKDALRNLFPDSFKFSMPLDIVGGDFVKVQKRMI